MNEVNIIETNNNKKYKKNMQQEAADTTKWFWQTETYITSLVFTYSRSMILSFNKNLQIQELKLQTFKPMIKLSDIDN